MQIHGPFRVSTTQAAAGTSPTGGASPNNRVANNLPPTRATAAPTDQLDLSATNRLDATSAATQTAPSEIRVDRVAQLRREIAEGTYETPDKLDAALDRLLDQIG